MQLLTPETIKLLGTTKSKIIKDENVENISRLEITVVALAQYNVVNNDYQLDSRILFTFVPNKSFSQLLDISLKMFIFKNL